MDHAEDKRATFEEMLRTNTEVFCQVDTKVAGVDVPAHLMGDRFLRLKFSYNFAPFDMEICIHRISQTLTFARRPFRVVLPWRAIYIILAGGVARIYPGGAVPDEIVKSAIASLQEDSAPKKPAGLRLVRN